MPGRPHHRHGGDARVSGARLHSRRGRAAVTGLTAGSFRRGLRALGERDPDLRRVVRSLGAPPMWARAPGFPTLIHIILEQQVSLASAQAAFTRLLERASPLTPRRLLALDDVTLKSVGFSRQKTAYARQLARAIRDGRLDLAALSSLDETGVRSHLMAIKGIGRWSADIYLLMALRRPDIWPVGDLALASAAQRVKRTAGRPTPDELERLGARWRPWRAIAARILWHYYLSHNSSGGGER